MIIVLSIWWLGVLFVPFLCHYLGLRIDGTQLLTSSFVFILVLYTDTHTIGDKEKRVD